MKIIILSKLFYFIIINKIKIFNISSLILYNLLTIYEIDTFHTFFSLYYRTFNATRAYNDLRY